MKGTVVKIWINTLRRIYNADEINSVIESIGLDPKRAISPLENIDDKIVEKMFSAIAEHYKITKSQLWDIVGKDNIKSFHNIYPLFFKKANMFLFLSSLNDIHVVVRKRVSGSNPPALDMQVIGKNEATITYKSNRNMFDYFIGLLDGTIEHFKENVKIEELSRKDGILVLKLSFDYELIENKTYVFNKLLSLNLIKSFPIKLFLFSIIPSLILSKIVV